MHLCALVCCGRLSRLSCALTIVDAVPVTSTPAEPRTPCGVCRVPDVDGCQCGASCRSGTALYASPHNDIPRCASGCASAATVHTGRVMGTVVVLDGVRQCVHKHDGPGLKPRHSSIFKGRCGSWPRVPSAGVRVVQVCHALGGERVV